MTQLAPVSDVAFVPHAPAPVPASFDVRTDRTVLVVRPQRELGADGQRWLLDLLARPDDPRAVRIDLGATSDVSFAMLAALASAASRAPRPVALTGLTERQTKLLRYLGLAPVC